VSQASAAAAAGPLAGVRVLEMGTLIAGPFCARLLAEFGAEVTKVESPDGGDPLRSWRRLHQGTSLWWFAQGRNKRSVALDLRDPQAQEAARHLAAGADVVVENFRPGTLERWGLGWDRLSALNPGLVMVRLSGYGQTGPYRDRPGFGAIAEAMGGLRHLTGEPGRPPVRVGVSIGDSIAALYGAFGALAALRHREVNGGRGQVVDVALYEAVFGLMESLLPEYDAQGFVRGRTGAALPGIVPSNTYPTGDGRYVVIGANADAIFRRLMNAIGRPDLAQDPALARNEGRVARTAEIDGVIAAWTGARPIDEVLGALEAAEVPASRIYDIADIVRDPQYAARGMFERVPLPGGGSVALPGIVPRLSGTPGATRWPGPPLGAHTREALRAAGLTDPHIDALVARGVAVCPEP
jgi:formyl-CoA transferase